MEKKIKQERGMRNPNGRWGINSEYGGQGRSHEDVIYAETS
jgi:hypothetical protein